MLFTRTEIPEPVTGPQALNWVVFALNMAILVFSVTLGLRMWLMAPERRPSASAEIVRDEIDKALENSVRAKGCIVVLMDAREGHICQGHRAELFNIQAAQRNAYFISVAAQKAENTWENFIAGRSEAWQTLSGKAWSRHKFCLGREWLAKSDRDRFGVGNVVLARSNAYRVKPRETGVKRVQRRARGRARTKKASSCDCAARAHPDVDDDERQGVGRRRGGVAEPAREQSSGGGRGVARKTENAADRRCRRRTGSAGPGAVRERKRRRAAIAASSCDCGVELRLQLDRTPDVDDDERQEPARAQSSGGGRGCGAEDRNGGGRVRGRAREKTTPSRDCAARARWVWWPPVARNTSRASRAARTWRGRVVWTQRRAEPRLRSSGIRADARQIESGGQRRSGFVPGASRFRSRGGTREVLKGVCWGVGGLGCGGRPGEETVVVVGGKKGVPIRTLMRRLIGRLREALRPKDEERRRTGGDGGM
ncbi:hypothetical protein C8R43DRAFT_942209 [Mycena crocata]|nr:hypothetical protein C8R43DRAFT_942209 [Mycena crocata]